MDLADNPFWGNDGKRYPKKISWWSQKVKLNFFGRMPGPALEDMLPIFDSNKCHGHLEHLQLIDECSLDVDKLQQCPITDEIMMRTTMSF